MSTVRAPEGDEIAVVVDEPQAPRSDRAVDIVLLVAFAIVVVLVHPVHDMLTRPWWIDEAWVADAARAPWTRLAGLSSSTPLGWMALIKLVPGTGLQRQRMATLAFWVATSAVAYLLARDLNWRTKFESRCGAIIATTAVVLAPSALLRNDLKQYSADAFFTLLLVLFANRADRRPGRAPLTLLGVVIVLALPFSSASVFVAVAVFAGLLGATAVRRDWPRLRAVLVAGCATGAIVLVWLVTVMLPNDTKNLRDFWHKYYLTGSVGHRLGGAWHLGYVFRSSFGLPTYALSALFVVGCAVLWTRGHIAMAVAAVVLWMELIALGATRNFPFLDFRTSTFILILTTFIAAVGVAWIAFAIVPRRKAAIVGVMIVTVGWLGFAARDQVRKFDVPFEDARTQARMIHANLGPNDVVVVSRDGNWGFGYYWPDRSQTSYVMNPSQTVGFDMPVNGINQIIPTTRNAPEIEDALRAAVLRWRALGGTGRIWLAVSHANEEEIRGFTRALRKLNIDIGKGNQSDEPLVVADASESTVR